MTKPAKLYEQLLAKPSMIISFRDFERLLEAFGWVLRRTKGSHRIMCTRACRSCRPLIRMANRLTATKCGACLNSLRNTAYI